MHKSILSRGLALALIAAPLAMSVSTSAHADELSCKMKFSVTGWSVLYKTAKGVGHVTCSNGQKARVHLKTTGGGLVVGKSTIDDGKGDFTGIKDISNIYGDYAAAQGEVGAVKTAEGTVVSKGEVNLALGGTGRGWDLGVSFSKFSITPYPEKVAATAK
jgi:hypothetical protein